MFEKEAVPISTNATRIFRPVRLTVSTDLALYAALAGKLPEIDPTLADPVIAASRARRENPWSPTVLSIYLRQICREQAVKISKPELTAWVRRQSQVAKKRFVETQARLATDHRRAA